MINEDTLQAYVDGALSPEEAADVVIYLADHPEEQRRVDALMALNETLARAYDAPMQEPIPQSIHETILTAPFVAPQSEESATLMPFPTAQKRPSAHRGLWFGAGLALAASVALAAVIVPGLLERSGPMQLALGPVSEGSVLDHALDRLPSGSAHPLDRDGELRVMASYQTQRRGLCREVQMRASADAEATAALACQAGPGFWDIALITRLPGPAQHEGFVPANGAEADPIGQYLERVGAGIALSAKSEAEALSLTQ